MHARRKLKSSAPQLMCDPYNDAFLIYQLGRLFFHYSCRIRLVSTDAWRSEVTDAKNVSLLG
jgi:hypothetical protein